MFANFFDGFTASQLIVMLVGAIYAVFQVFVPGISPIAWLQDRFPNLVDLKMQLIVQGFFMILSALAMWLTGELADIGFTLQSLIEYFGVFYGLSQLAYQGLKARQNGS